MAEFWGVEVKSGEPLVVNCGDNFIVHLSQACLGEAKKDKGNESVCLTVKIDDKKIVLGNLSSEKLPQLSFDLIFEKDFELLHNWKHGSVYFSGYKILRSEMTEDDESESEPEFLEDFPLAANNDARKPERLTEKDKPQSDGSKQKVKIVEPKKDEKLGKESDDSDDTSGDEDDSSDEDDSEDKDMMANVDADNSDEDEETDDDSEGSAKSDESDDEDEKIPTMVKTEQGKKRSAESVKKTPLPDKKVKLVTPQKTDGNKTSGHVATPHPSKKILKTPATSSDQKKEQNLKSFPCASCNRLFGSEIALQSHTKAKHSAA